MSMRPYSPAATTMRRSVLFSRASCGLLPTGKQTALRAAGDRVSHTGQFSGRKLPFPQRVPASAGRRQSSLSCCASPEGRLKALLEEHPAIGVKLLQCFLASLSEKIMRSNELRKKRQRMTITQSTRFWRSEHGDFCRQMKHRALGAPHLIGATDAGKVQYYNTMR